MSPRACQYFTMKKVRAPRFSDHVHMGEKPKFKSFLLRIHQADQGIDGDNSPAENEDSAKTSPPKSPPRPMRSHPKKRLQSLFLDEDKSEPEDDKISLKSPSPQPQSIFIKSEFRVPPIVDPQIYQLPNNYDNHQHHPPPLPKQYTHEIHHQNYLQSRHDSTPINDVIYKDSNNSGLYQSYSYISHQQNNDNMNLPYHPNSPPNQNNIPMTPNSLHSKLWQPFSDVDGNRRTILYPGDYRQQPEEVQDLRMPNNSRRPNLEELISDVSSCKQRTLPQLVPSRPTKYKHYKDRESMNKKQSETVEQQNWSDEPKREHKIYQPIPTYPQQTQINPYTSPHGHTDSRYPNMAPQFTSDYYASYPPQRANSSAATPPTLSARSKTLSWLSESESAFTNTSSTSSESELQDIKKPETGDLYKSISITRWESRDVAHFLIEAMHALQIGIEMVDFSILRNIDGNKIMSMEPRDFDKFAPGAGQRVYEYVKQYRQESSHKASSSSHESSSVLNTSHHNSNNQYSIATTSQEYQTSTVNSSQHFYQSSSTDQIPFPPPSNEIQTSFPVQQSPDSKRMFIPHTSQSTDFHQVHRREDLATAAVKTFNPVHDSALNFDYGRNRRISNSARKMTMMYNGPEQVSDDDSSDDDDDEDDDEEEEEEEILEEVKIPEPPKKRGPGRPPKPENERKKKKKNGRLWEFIRNLLLNPETCPSIVKWEDAEDGTFRFLNSEKVAERWGMRKNNQKMNYEKLSRAMRYYYKGKIFEPVLGRRLVYKFGPNAKGWKPNQGNYDKT